MRRVSAAAALAVSMVVSIGLLAAPVALAAGPASGVVFDSIPTPLPGNVASVGFEATSTSEFGDYATFDAGNPSRHLRNVDVVMSSWGCETGTWNGGDCVTTTGATFSHPITFTIYANSAGAPGAVLGTVTQTFAIPFRPSADPTNCTDAGKWYDATDTTCYNGFATTITFDFSTMNLTLPEHVIYGVSYNTTHYGAAPIGEAASCFSGLGGCGYDSLNVGAESATPSTGTDDDPNGVFQNSTSGGSYCDAGVGGTGTFRADTPCWTGYNPLVRFNAVASLGACLVDHNVATKTDTLLADCTTDQTIHVANGWTLDGAGHTITGVDPSGGHFVGAVVQGDAGPLSDTVKNLTVTVSGLADVCDAGAAALRGILFDGVSGTITNDHVTDIEQGTGGLSGCQEGDGIEVRNSAGVTPKPTVTISNNVVTDYQKTGILSTGNVVTTITHNVVTGDGPIAYIAQNGIQVSFGATAKLTGNDVSLNNYTPKKVVACGLLIYKAGGVSGASKSGLSFVKADNTFHDNEQDICNFGKGGAFSPVP